MIATPDLLDGIRVEDGDSGKRVPLAELATVSVKDGSHLIVSVYEESVSPCFPSGMWPGCVSRAAGELGIVLSSLPLASPRAGSQPPLFRPFVPPASLHPELRARYPVSPPSLPISLILFIPRLSAVR